MAARRRTRRSFIATAPDGTTKQVNVLCYSDEFAWKYLEAAGYYDIEKIVKSRPRVPASQATWRKNDRAIQEALEMLGLKLPVTIKLTGHTGGRRGGYRPTSNGAGHHITIKNYLTPERAGRTLWHELAHAMQFERESGKWIGHAALLKWEASDIHRGRYEHRPCEVEARKFEEYNDACPLTLPA